METIKLTIDVVIKLSDDTKTFVSSLFAAKTSQANVKVPPAPAPATTSPVTAKEQKETKLAIPAQSETQPSVSIEDIRQILVTKVSNHRQEIKEKLNSLGAPSVSKLEQSKYKEMYDFLNGLD